MSKLSKLWKSIGPGFITGASDDDPSGIATYSIAGAKFGLATLWLALITIPFMIAIQEMSGRIGLVTKRGLVGNMKRHYPSIFVIVLTLLVVFANIVNIGANIAGMSAAFSVVVPSVNSTLLASLISLAVIFALIVFSYDKLASYLKWTAMVLFAYILSAFFITIDWGDVLKNTLIPHIEFSKEYMFIIVAILGTTVSPYLFFWQANEEVEMEIDKEKRTGVKKRSSFVMKNEIASMQKDTRAGMFFSNGIMFFIIILSASTLFASGMNDVSSIEEIATVLEPIAGKYSSLLFLIGIMGSGILAIPVLAGSAAYALAEAFGWKEGMNKKFMQAPHFYMVIVIATLLGLLMPIFGVDPVKALLYTAVIYGAIAPLLILMILHMANNRKIMGEFTNSTLSNTIGALLFIVMTVATLTLVI